MLSSIYLGESKPNGDMYVTVLQHKLTRDHRTGLLKAKQKVVIASQCLHREPAIVK